MNTSIEISSEALVANLHALRAAAGAETEVLAVIKANAYGHGAVVCGKMLADAGVSWFGVTSAEEGGRVREALTAQGQDADILVMSGFLPEDVVLLREHALTPVVWTAGHVAALAGRSMPIHVEVDTGMGRQGVRPGVELAALLRQIVGSGLQLGGLFTHYCSSEEADSPLTRAQQSAFEQCVAQVGQAGLRPAWVHAGNSSSVDNPAGPPAWLARLASSVGAQPMVRTGLALYGYCLPIEGLTSLPQVACRLLPVLTWKARVLAVRDLQPGETTGYNATFTAPEPMRVALLPVGYADGLRRELSSTNTRPGGSVMIRGERALILGRISMNLTVVDVTAIPGVAAGDEAILLGEGFNADDHARIARTISYEILCGIHPCG